MSKELEQRLAILEGKPDMIKQTNSYLKWLQVAIVIIAVILGVGANYQMTKSNIAILQTQVAEIKEDRDKKEALWKAETDKLKTEVVTLKMKGAAGDQWRTTTTETLGEIKQKLDELAKKRIR